MADPIDAVVDAVQAPAADAIPDRRVANPELAQLRGLGVADLQACDGGERVLAAGVREAGNNLKHVHRGQTSLTKLRLGRINLRHPQPAGTSLRFLPPGH